jgi:hypothetical protein
MFTRHQQGFTVIHPMPAFPSPVAPGRNGALGLSPGLHTRLGRTQPRMPGRGRARTLPGLRPWHQPASFDALTHHVRPPVATINHLVAGAAPTRPADPGKAGCPFPLLPGRRGWSPRTERQAPTTKHPHALPAPPAGHDPLPGRPHQGRPPGAGYAGRAPARSLTRLPARRTRQLSGQGADSSTPKTKATHAE